MSEYILNVDDEGAAHQIIDKFGIDETKVYGYSFTGEEIVRCRDCYFGEEVYWPSNSKTPSDWLDCMGPMVETWDYWNDEPQDNPVPPDGFCAWGARRDA